MDWMLTPNAVRALARIVELTGEDGSRLQVFRGVAVITPAGSDHAYVVIDHEDGYDLGKVEWVE